MSKVWHIGDTHFGHRAIGKYREHLGIKGHEDNFEKIKYDWNSLVKKRDKVYVHGDGAFDKESISLFGQLNGNKVLILGNHDCLDIEEWSKYFSEVCGCLSYKNCWLTHIPVHPFEMTNRQKLNIHGHVHMNTIHSSEFFNVSCDWLKFKYGQFLITHEQIKTLTGI